MSSPTPPVIPGLLHVQRLGSGGFADVHLYRQELPRMLVAVKVLHTSATDLRQQLVDEANTMAELAEHPYIVTVLRAGTTDEAGGGRPYLVMAYLPKPNLAVRARGNPLAVDQVLRTGVQLASAVETAHRAGVLHRDIKPANVLVSSYGTPALADFGIAGRAATVDDTEDVGVSIAWAPPEVLRGRSNGSVAADVYSLTATLSYLLTGRAPFEDVGGDNSADGLLVRASHEPPRRTGRTDVPESLERLLRQGLAKDPAHRPSSALSLALDLQRVEQELRLPRTEVVVLADGDDGLHTVTGAVTTRRAATPAQAVRPDELPPATPPPTPHRHVPEDPPRPARRPRWPWVVAAAAAVLLLAGVGAVGVSLLGDDDATSTASTDGSTSGSTTGSTEGSTSEPSTTASTAAGGLDPCLVGTWTTERYSEQTPLGELTDLEREMTFTDDGRLTIRYDQARPKGAGGGWVFDGEVEYDVTTSGETMSFDLVRDDLSVTVGGAPFDAPPGTGGVTYTCSDGAAGTFTESSAGLDATFARQ